MQTPEPSKIPQNSQDSHPEVQWRCENQASQSPHSVLQPHPVPAQVTVGSSTSQALKLSGLDISETSYGHGHPNTGHPSHNLLSASPPPLPKHWHQLIKNFLVLAGLDQAVRGFEADMMMLNEAFERERLPLALDALRNGLVRLNQTGQYQRVEEPLDDRKLDYVSTPRGIEKQNPTSLNKSISVLLARNRARNNVSNRAEFLLSGSEKRAQYAALGRKGTTEDTASGSTSLPSCARTDARMLDRDIHMKFDIAQNDEGPLRKTIMDPSKQKGKQRANAVDVPPDVPTADKHPGLDERLVNMESHLAVKYVPAPPLSLLDRIKHIEDHIVKLERDNPPWAALHFNQPRRGWPPPPRPVPLIVDPRTTISTGPLNTVDDYDTQMDSSAGGAVSLGVDHGKGRAKKGSSLHRAIVEKLEVQRAKAEAV